MRQRFNENLDLIESKFKQNNVAVKGYVEKINQIGFAKMEEERAKMETLLEGRTQ